MTADVHVANLILDVFMSGFHSIMPCSSRRSRSSSGYSRFFLLRCFFGLNWKENQNRGQRWELPRNARICWNDMHFYHISSYYLFRKATILIFFSLFFVREHISHSFIAFIFFSCFKFWYLFFISFIVCFGMCQSESQFESKKKTARCVLRTLKVSILYYGWSTHFIESIIRLKLIFLLFFLFFHTFAKYRSSECDVVRGECTQTYVPYLFLVIPLGPVTLTGQDYVLVESGCVCKPKYASEATTEPKIAP